MTLFIYDSTTYAFLSFSSCLSCTPCPSVSSSLLSCLFFPICSSSFRAHSRYPQFLKATLTYSVSVWTLLLSLIKVYAWCISILTMPSFWWTWWLDVHCRYWSVWVAFLYMSVVMLLFSRIIWISSMGSYGLHLLSLWGTWYYCAVGWSVETAHPHTISWWPPQCCLHTGPISSGVVESRWWLSARIPPWRGLQWQVKGEIPYPAPYPCHTSVCIPDHWTWICVMPLPPGVDRQTLQGLSTSSWTMWGLPWHAGWLSVPHIFMAHWWRAPWCQIKLGLPHLDVSSL